MKIKHFILEYSTTKNSIVLSLMLAVFWILLFIFISMLSGESLDIKEYGLDGLILAYFSIALFFWYIIKSIGFFVRVKSIGWRRVLFILSMISGIVSVFILWDELVDELIIVAINPILLFFFAPMFITGIVIWVIEGFKRDMI